MSMDGGGGSAGCIEMGNGVATSALGIGASDGGVSGSVVASGDGMLGDGYDASADG
jgi:hypothetical protein